MSPHTAGHSPQSTAQLEQVSPTPGAQTPSPQSNGHSPQSPGQLRQVSSPRQRSSPQEPPSLSSGGPSGRRAPSEPASIGSSSTQRPSAEQIIPSGHAMKSLHS